MGDGLSRTNTSRRSRPRVLDCQGLDVKVHVEWGTKQAHLGCIQLTAMALQSTKAAEIIKTTPPSRSRLARHVALIHSPDNKPPGARYKDGCAGVDRPAVYSLPAWPSIGLPMP